MARHSQTLNYTGALQTVTIPASYVGGFQFDIAAGQGGQGSHSSTTTPTGGRVTGGYSPNVGDTINVYVGGSGGAVIQPAGSAPAGAAGGWGYHSGGGGGAGAAGIVGGVAGGWGAGGAGGGGSSAVLDGVTLIAEAGGGGGEGAAANTGPDNYGGYGGAVTAGGQSGEGATIGDGGGGGGATSSAGGAAGAAGPANPGADGNPGAAGAAGTGSVGGTGGAGGAATVNNWLGGSGGGGGGGGSFGGGGGGGGGGGVGCFGGGGGGGVSTAPNAISPAFIDHSQVGPGYATVTWQTRPTATVVGPTGTVTNTSTPTLQGNYASADSAPQQAYRVVVYSAAQTMPQAPALPTTAAPLYDSGTVYSSGPGVSLTPTPLPNGTLFVYIAFQDASGADSLWSAWASGSWTQAAPTPQTPAIAVNPIAATARVNLSITAPDNFVSLADSDFESGIAATSWAAGANTTLGTSSAQALHGTLAMTATNSSAGTATLSGNTAPGVSGYQVQPGQKYAFQGWFRTAVTSRLCQIGAAWYDSHGVIIGAPVYGATVSDGTAGWAQATAVLTAPANAAWAAVTFQIAGTAASEVHYLDEVGVTYSPAGTVSGWVAGGVYPKYFTVQRSTDGGVTWTTVAGGSQVSANGAAVSFDDVGAPREQNLAYRVQAVATGAGVTLASSWTATASTYLPSDGNDWLMSSANRGLCTKVTYQGPNLSAVSHEDQAAYYPEGRQDAVIFHGTIHYEAFISGIGSQILLFAFPNDKAWQNFVAIRAAQAPVCLKTVYGDTSREQFWLVLGPDAGTTRVGGGEKQFAGQGFTNQIRTVQISAYVVNEPV